MPSDTFRNNHSLTSFFVWFGNDTLTLDVATASVQCSIPLSNPNFTLYFTLTNYVSPLILSVILLVFVLMRQTKPLMDESESETELVNSRPASVTFSRNETRSNTPWGIRFSRNETRSMTPWGTRFQDRLQQKLHTGPNNKLPYSI